MKLAQKGMFKITIIIFLVVFFILLATGCGFQRTLRNHCHLGDTQTCDNLFGVNQTEIDEAQTSQLADQQKQIDSLTTMMQELAKDVRNVEADLTQVNTMINLLHSLAQSQGADIVAINQMLVDLNQDVVDLENTISYEQARINDLAVDVAELQAQDSVIETVYACGDAPNKFDEGLLKTKSGKLIAYFESGSNRFLTELKPGNYRSTDYSPYCYFTVNANNEIVNAQRR